jgi:hypothetical protein
VVRIAGAFNGHNFYFYSHYPLKFALGALILVFIENSIPQCQMEFKMDIVAMPASGVLW